MGLLVNPRELVWQYLWLEELNRLVGAGAMRRSQWEGVLRQRVWHTLEQSLSWPILQAVRNHFFQEENPVHACWTGSLVLNEITANESEHRKARDFDLVLPLTSSAVAQFRAFLSALGPHLWGIRRHTHGEFYRLAKHPRAITEVQSTECSVADLKWLLADDLHETNRWHTVNYSKHRNTIQLELFLVNHPEKSQCDAWYWELDRQRSNYGEQSSSIRERAARERDATIRDGGKTRHGVCIYSDQSSRHFTNEFPRCLAQHRKLDVVFVGMEDNDISNASVWRWICRNFDLDICANAVFHGQTYCLALDHIYRRTAVFRDGQYCHSIDLPIFNQLGADAFSETKREIDPECIRAKSNGERAWNSVTHWGFEIKPKVKLLHRKKDRTMYGGGNNCFCDQIVLERIFKYTKRGFLVTNSPRALERDNKRKK